MPNMSMKKVAIAEQDANKRNKNFLEVSLGYTLAEATEEAERCLNCKNPKCVEGCPVSVPIPDFITKIKEGNLEESYGILSGANALPAVCGRVCPQESQCEKLCVRGVKGEAVGIGRLERFVADWARENNVTSDSSIVANGHKVAVVGSGPAGLTCAGELAKMGYDVTVYEALHVAGGVLSYGIPEFRLPKDIVKKEIAGLQKIGVKIELNMVIGKILSIDELFEMGFDAVFVGSGAGLPTFMKVPGEGLCGVYSANEYLTRVNLMKGYEEGAKTPVMKSKKAAIIGGGNVAMDAARCAKRMGTDEVYIVYRRGEEELPARLEEVHHAKEEDIIFKLLTAPLSLEGDESGRVSKMKCIEMELGEPDASGRRRPVEKQGSEFDLDVDMVIVAIGTSPNPLIRQTTPGLDINKWGCITTDDAGLTSRDGIFAGGDVSTGAATVILAMGAGKMAAASIDEYIKEKKGL